MSAKNVRKREWNKYLFYANALFTRVSAIFLKNFRFSYNDSNILFFTKCRQIYKERILMKQIFKLGEFARLISVHPRTLQRWDSLGILIAYRTPTNRRYYTYEQYLKFIK